MNHKILMIDDDQELCKIMKRYMVNVLAELPNIMKENGLDK